MKNILKKLRDQHGLTQDELAERVGVSRQTIISLEKGKYDPSIKLAFKLAQTLNSSIENIFIYEMENDEIDD